MKRTGPKEKGFTLLELMITVSIIGIIAAIAIPSFKKYLNDSRITEGVIILGDALRDEQKSKSITGQWSEYLTEPTTSITGELQDQFRPIDYRPNGKTKFNLIVGAQITKIDSIDFSSVPNSLDQLSGGQFPNVTKKVNQFGIKGSYKDTNPSSPTFGMEIPDPSQIMIGVEADLTNDGYLQVMSVTNTGALSVLCDAFNRSKSDAYDNYYGATLNCCRTSQQVASGGGNSANPGFQIGPALADPGSSGPTQGDSTVTCSSGN